MHGQQNIKKKNNDLL